MKSRILVIFSVLACLLFGVAATAAKADDSAVTVSVPANNPWTDSGVYVNAGDLVTITGSGIIHVSTTDPGTRPAGLADCVAPDTDSNPSQAFVAPGLTCWSLIGRIGTNPAFEIGAGTSFAAASSGELDLGVNDNYFPDNSGAWTVTVTTVAQP
jgi:hypothetical protein